MSIGELLEDTELLEEVLLRHVVTGNNIRDLNKRRSEVQTLDVVLLVFLSFKTHRRERL